MLLLRGATVCSSPAPFRKSSFNTCSSCEEQPFCLVNRLAPHVVSIHAPLARSNSIVYDGKKALKCFNTCSSCEEQHFRDVDGRLKTRFNTCSSCEEQQDSSGRIPRQKGFNTCSSCEEQLHSLEHAGDGIAFQYMLLLRGATKERLQRLIWEASFNTCSSCEEQLDFYTFRAMLLCFNTCSSCEEQRYKPADIKVSDSFNTCSSCEEQLPRKSRGSRLSRFNTCSSCEEQQTSSIRTCSSPTFQYMLLLRGATDFAEVFGDECLFQYMLLLRGATLWRVQVRILLCRFNTCSSCEEQPTNAH